MQFGLFLMIIALQIKFLSLLLLVISSFFVHHTIAFYGDPNIPLTIPSTYGSLALTVKDSIYLIGGRVVLHNTSDVNMNNISVITFSSDGEMQIQNKVPINAPGSCYPCYGYSLPDGDTIVVANVPYPSYNYTGPDNITDILQPGGLGFYHISNNSWTYGRSPRYAGTLSPLMSRFTSAISTDKKFIYVLGGEYYLGGYISNNNYDLKFEINNSSNVQEVNFNTTISILSSSSITLPSGNTVIAFGKYYDAEDDIEIMNSTSQVLLFDEKTETYTVKQIKADSRGRFPVGRIDASCALGPDNSSIYFFGGSDSIISANNTINEYNVTVYNDIAILDTVTWSWVLPDIAGLKPLPASGTSMTLFDTNKLFIGTGRQGYIYTGSPSVLSDVPLSSQSLLSNNLKWFTNNPQYDDYRANKNGLSDGAIAGIVIAVFAILAILFALLWVYVPNTKRVVNYIQQDLIWSPRSGEPLWAETSRLLVRFILLFLFLAFVAFVIWKSVNSATVVQQIKNPVNAVLAPDIRFCFDGFNQSSSLNSPYDPFVTCLVRNGTNCSGKILPLDISMYPPASNFGALSCFLFLPGLEYYLVDSKGGYTDSVGSKLIFSFFAQNTTADITKGVIYVDFYAPSYDPNTVMYNLTKLENTKLTQTQIDQWVASEQANNAVDTIILKQTVKSTASYTLTTKKTLKNDGWNYIGFSSNYDETVNIDTIFKEVPQNSDYMPQTFYTQQLAQLTVQPREFTENFDVEQKVFTLLNAFAQAGGVLGLFIALQTILFGFRPQSPWGIVHRWSFGKLRVRLTDRLANYFNKTGTPVPLVNPVSNRLSVVNGQSYFKDDVESTYVPLGPNVPSANDPNEAVDEEERIQRVEERLQLMELLLKSYYLNDEVFRSLDQAVKRGKQGRYQGKFVNSGTKDSDSALNNNMLNEELGLNNSKEETSTAKVKRRPSSTVFQQRDIYQPRLAPDPIELLYDNNDHHLVNANNEKK